MYPACLLQLGWQPRLQAYLARALVTQPGENLYYWLTSRKNTSRKATNEMGRWFPGGRNKSRGLSLLDDDDNRKLLFIFILKCNIVVVPGCVVVYCSMAGLEYRVSNHPTGASHLGHCSNSWLWTYRLEQRIWNYSNHSSSLQCSQFR